MLVFDRPRQHDDLACMARHQREASLGRADVGQRPQHGAKPPDFDSQTRAMRFIGELRSEARATSASRGTSSGQASPSARASANNTGRVASETTLPS